MLLELFRLIYVMAVMPWVRLNGKLFGKSYCPRASPGIITGIILSMGRAAGKRRQLCLQQRFLWRDIYHHLNYSQLWLYRIFYIFRNICSRRFDQCLWNCVSVINHCFGVLCNCHALSGKNEESHHKIFYLLR